MDSATHVFRRSLLWLLLSLIVAATPRDGMAQAGTLDPAAMAQLGQTAGGEFLGANPYLDAAAQQIQDRATQQFTEEIAPAIATVSQKKATDTSWSPIIIRNPNTRT